MDACFVVPWHWHLRKRELRQSRGDSTGNGWCQPPHDRPIEASSPRVKRGAVARMPLAHPWNDGQSQSRNLRRDRSHRERSWLATILIASSQRPFATLPSTRRLLPLRAMGCSHERAPILRDRVRAGPTARVASTLQSARTPPRTRPHAVASRAPRLSEPVQVRQRRLYAWGRRS